MRALYAFRHRITASESCQIVDESCHSASESCHIVTMGSREGVMAHTFAIIGTPTEVDEHRTDNTRHLTGSLRRSRIM